MAPNEKEARFSLGDQDSSVRPLGEALFAESKAKLVVLKVGADGAIGYRRRLEGTDPRHFFVVDSMTNNAVDAIGAGDALLAYSSLALHARANPVVATSIGVAAASLACERNGNTPVRPVDVLKRIRQKVDGF
jgi:sugar/nucleoside kinase (ribokinase family)